MYNREFIRRLIRVEALAKQNGMVCQRMGVVGGDKLKIGNMIDLSVGKLSESWRDVIVN